MKVLFLEIDTESDWAVASLGPGFLAATLRAHGHAAAFLRLGIAMGLEDILAALRDQAPDLIGISATTRQWLRARALLADLRRVSNIPTILGGLHATFAPEEVLKSPGIDYVCLGEGESALLDLVEALAAGGDTTAIGNIWAKGAPRPAIRPPVEPIDSIPFAARDLLDERYGVVHVSTQRGCPLCLPRRHSRCRVHRVNAVCLTHTVTAKLDSDPIRTTKNPRDLNDHGDSLWIQGDSNP